MASYSFVEIIRPLLTLRLETDKYPLPKPDDLFATLSRGQKFSKIDVINTYKQVELELQELVTVSIHRGLYHFMRLPFGVASAPAVFQKVMDTFLQGIDGVIRYLDDILVSSDTYFPSAVPRRSVATTV